MGGGYDNFVATTGIVSKRHASNDTCASDLCVSAAEKLIYDLKWDKSEIDAVVFVTQTPDYQVPATSPIIQDRLGLSTNCLTLDISLGCSGWVYGMSVISALMQSGSIKKGLLLAGDTPTKFCSQNDKSTYPLFGDAGTATALEYNLYKEESFKFCLFSDGTGSDSIKINDGGYRNQFTGDSLSQKSYGDGIIKSDVDLYLDGMSVFSFGISKAPQSIKLLIEHFNLDISEIDLFSFHQANMFMNEKIRKKLKLDVSKVPYSLSQFGNTSCASIPLTLVTQSRKSLTENTTKHIGCGFGVGLSWGAVYFETNKIIVPQLIEL